METKKSKGRPREATKDVQQKGRDMDNHLERTPKSIKGQSGVLPAVSRIAVAKKIPDQRDRRRLIADNKSKKEPIDEILSVEKWMEMTETMKKEPQIIQDLLPDEPGSYGVIAGRTGIGKTNLVLHLAHCLATGTEFFGLECQEVNVAVVAFEDDPKNLLERLKKNQSDLP